MKRFLTLAVVMAAAVFPMAGRAADLPQMERKQLTPADSAAADNLLVSADSLWKASARLNRVSTTTYRPSKAAIDAMYRETRPTSLPATNPDGKPAIAAAYRSAAPASAPTLTGKTFSVNGKIYREFTDGTLIPCPECNLSAPASTPAANCPCPVGECPCPAGQCPCPAAVRAVAGQPVALPATFGPVPVYAPTCQSGTCGQASYSQGPVIWTEAPRYRQSGGCSSGFSGGCGSSSGGGCGSSSGGCGLSSRPILGAPIRIVRGVFGCGG